ncbi:MAG: winged helix-turn-helix transcriptional regulator [Candidatus Taylorbacteria bacterium]|nr:winged helix-turn-helix transcriptional regulator [Candidatus Taylorbacteria bacterium]
MYKPRQLERIVKGFSNHRRIDILRLLAKRPELSVLDISTDLKINFKTASEHIRRLAIAGAVMKRSEGRAIRHALTPRGENILRFLRILE